MPILRPMQNGSVDVENPAAEGSSLLRATGEVSFVDNEEAGDGVAIDIPVGAQVVGIRITSINDDTALGNLPAITGAGYRFYVLCAGEGSSQGANVTQGYDDATLNIITPSGGPLIVSDLGLSLVAIIGNADGTEGGPFTLDDLATAAQDPILGIQVQVLYYIP